jgi:L-2-hydroxyglutarate oxidase LhgO
MTSLLGDLEAAGGVLATHTNARSVRPVADGLELEISSGDTESSLCARTVVNCAGLGAVDLTRRIAGYPAAATPRAYLAKGTYFACASRPFQRLVYPMPNEAGLGVHATLDLDGTVRFGPDVEWVDEVAYDVEAARGKAFYAAIREYWPGLPDGALTPAYAGMRPKIVGPGEPAADFVIAGPCDHGVAGLVNLLGIESPGLTSALAIGAHVRAVVDG